MLSKRRSQVLRLAPVLNLLYNYGSDTITHVISEEAIKAAINFVEFSREQTAKISGRGGVKETIMKCQACIHTM